MIKKTVQPIFFLCLSVLLTLFLSLALTSTSYAADAGDATLGKTKAAVCTACHGPEGVSVNGLWPNLAGQKGEYIMKQLHAFQEGTRVDPVMSGFAKALNDQDIKDLAAYFSHLKGG